MDKATEPILERLVRIETKLDLAHTAETTRQKLEDDRHADHENRIRKLERSVWLMIGAAAAVGGGSGTLVAKILGGI